MNKLKRLLWIPFVFLFWIGVWWLLSLMVDNSYLLPSPFDTAISLFKLMKNAFFYKVVFSSLIRVIAGLLLGIIIGTLFAFISHSFVVFRKLITPIISIIKAMPVATFILLLWLTLRGSSLTIFIGFIMVMPIIYQNVIFGLDSTDKNLEELCYAYDFSAIKKIRFLIFPTLLSYLAPAIITSVGLAFKSQIAAEIIAYTKNSIGQYIYDANYSLDTSLVFAWAAVIVCFSIGLEAITKYLFGRVKDVG